jgi:hypothetical protein
MIRKSLSAVGAALMTLTVFSGTVAVMNFAAFDGSPEAYVA